MIAQLIGGLPRARSCSSGLCTARRFTSRSRIGLGANGYGRLSLLHASGGGAFLTEIIITAVFVLIVLSATRAKANVAIQGAVLGVALALVNIIGIPIDGASANPARSFGPAIVAGGPWLSQLWLFLIAPLVGAVLAAGVFMLFHPGEGAEFGPRMRAQPAMTVSAADEVTPQVGPTARTTTAPTSDPSSQHSVNQCRADVHRHAGLGPAAIGAPGRSSGGPDDPTGPVSPPGDMR